MSLKTLTCPVCNNIGHTSQTLERHILRVHLDYMPWKCALCVKIDYRKYTKDEMRVHCHKFHHIKNADMIYCDNREKDTELCLLMERAKGRLAQTLAEMQEDGAEGIILNLPSTSSASGSGFSSIPELSSSLTSPNDQLLVAVDSVINKIEEPYPKPEAIDTSSNPLFTQVKVEVNEDKEMSELNEESIQNSIDSSTPCSSRTVSLAETLQVNTISGEDFEVDDALEEIVINHLDGKTIDKIYCWVCDKYFPASKGSMAEIMTHISIHMFVLERKARFSCLLCLHGAATREDIQSHCIEKHGYKVCYDDNIRSWNTSDIPKMAKRCFRDEKFLVKIMMPKKQIEKESEERELRGEVSDEVTVKDKGEMMNEEIKKEEPSQNERKNTRKSPKIVSGRILRIRKVAKK